MADNRERALEMSKREVEAIPEKLLTNRTFLKKLMADLLIEYGAERERELLQRLAHNGMKFPEDLQPAKGEGTK